MHARRAYRVAGRSLWSKLTTQMRQVYSLPVTATPKNVDAQRALAMNRVNPKFILRNHLAEVAIRQAREGDYGEVGRLLKVLQRPYDEQPEHSAYADFPPVWANQIEVSCSS